MSLKIQVPRRHVDADVEIGERKPHERACRTHSYQGTHPPYRQEIGVEAIRRCRIGHPRTVGKTFDRNLLPQGVEVFKAKAGELVYDRQIGRASIVPRQLRHAGRIGRAVRM